MSTWRMPLLRGGGMAAEGDVGAAVFEYFGNLLAQSGCVEERVGASRYRLAAGNDLVGAQRGEAAWIGAGMTQAVDPVIGEARQTGLVITIEEQYVPGDLGGTVTEVMQRSAPVALHRLGLRGHGESVSFASDHLGGDTVTEDVVCLLM